MFTKPEEDYVQQYQDTTADRKPLENQPTDVLTTVESSKMVKEETTKFKKIGHHFIPYHLRLQRYNKIRNSIFQDKESIRFNVRSKRSTIRIRKFLMKIK